MSESSPTDNTLSLPELFHAMMAIDGSRAYLLGRDDWRRDIISREGTKVDTLENVDPELALAVSRQAKSKGGSWDRPDEWNLWPAVHIGLLLPSVAKALRSYGDEDIRLTYDEAVQHFSALPYIVQHCKEYEAFKTDKTEYGYEGKTPETIKAEWKERLERYLGQVDTKAPLPEILNNLPESLRSKVHTALRHHDAPTAENDSLIGRMILAYLGEKGVPYEKLGIDPRVKDYLRPLHDAPRNYPAKPLHERILDMHVESLPALMGQLPVLSYDQDTSLSMADFANIYRWYGTGKVVEMAKPDLVGAAQLGFSELSALFDKMENERGLDFHDHVQMTKGAQLFKNTQSLQQIGRLALVQDLIELSYEGSQQGGKPLRMLASQLWNRPEREAAWGNASQYVPESRADKRSFTVFRQDMVNILYSAGLFEEKHDRTELATALKDVAIQSRAADSLEQLGNILHEHAAVLQNWATQWNTLYPESRRTDIARFVNQTFALEAPVVVAVKQEEIDLGFEGSHYMPDRRNYHVHYREADDTRDIDVRIPKLPVIRRQADAPVQVTYQAETQDGIPVLEMTRPAGEILSVPVPARGSYDAFGTTGSPHAGEIIGYGCSVHHASLAVMLAELAALGAEREALQEFADKFMSINPGKHHRNMLADFQVEQIWTAFHEGRVISQADYLNNHPELRDRLLAEPGHEHTQQYLEHPDREPIAASATRGRLAYGYKELYPCAVEEAAQINARNSWYVTDVDARLADTDRPIEWQALNSASQDQSTGRRAGGASRA